MKVYIIATNSDKESRNRSAKQSMFLQERKIHHEFVYDQFAETAVIFQLPHAIKFRDFVREEMGSDQWDIVETELESYDGEDGGIVYNISRDKMQFVPQEAIDAIAIRETV